MDFHSPLFNFDDRVILTSLLYGVIAKSLTINQHLLTYKLTLLRFIEVNRKTLSILVLTLNLLFSKIVFYIILFNSFNGFCASRLYVVSSVDGINWIFDFLYIFTRLRHQRPILHDPLLQVLL